MTHSNGVEDKDVGGEYGGSVPTARYTRRFTLNLSDHTKRDAFDEFSYIELLNSELHESSSSVATERRLGDFYINTGTLDILLAEKEPVGETSITIRKRQKLVPQCLSQNSPELFNSPETLNLVPRMISKQEDVLPGEIVASNLPGSVSTCPSAVNLVRSVLPYFGGAANLLPTLISTHSTETAPDGSSLSSTPENHTAGFGHKSIVPDGLRHQICLPTFPDNLPVQLVDIIDQIKQAVGSSEYLLGLQRGRLRFTKEINQLLVQVENLSQSVTSLSRDMVFNHLASLLSCEPELLAKRAKKLRLAQNGDALKDPISRLKEEIQNIMPSLIERHNEEILAAERLLLLQLETKECSASRVTSDGRADEEVQDVSEEKMKRIVFPRKKFRWNQAIRMRLCEVVRLKMQQFKASKIQSQTAEEYLKAFLDAEIRPLWPRGWIQTRMLFKESRTSHQQWTMNLPKFKRMCVFGNKISRNPSITVQETVASGSSTPITTPSTVSVCSLQAKTLMDFAKTSCKVKSLKDEDSMGSGRYGRISQTVTNNEKWGAQLEKMSKTVGSGVSILSPTPILSPTLATKYWLLKAALESKTDSRCNGLYSALRKMDALGSVPASSVAVASASSSIVCSAASSVKIETDAQSRSSEFVGRSFEFLKTLAGPNGVAGGSGMTDGNGITDRTGIANGIGSVHTRLQELLQHPIVTSATLSHPTHLQSKPMESKFGPEKRMDTLSSPGKQSLSSSCSGFPSIFVFPPGTPLVGVVFCRAPMTSPQPFLAANTNKPQKDPTDSTFARSLLCGPGTTESVCRPVSSSQAPSVPHLGCPRNDVDVERNVNQTVANAPPPESPMLTAPFVAFPNPLSVFRQFLAPVTTP